YIQVGSKKQRRSMNKFLTIATILDSREADIICQKLEDHKISVIIEHVSLKAGGSRSNAYRVLVPETQVQKARLLMETVKKQLEDNSRAF
ncbi:MAG: hypothetical protein D6780_00705, partial [Candidatus Dadabacteria bacterium]